MQECTKTSACLALNYQDNSKTCEMTSVILDDTGTETFQNTGGEYLEKVHPLIAQSL